MKKAVHDTLGYLWVKNSVEADKKRQADIAQENVKIYNAEREKRKYDFGANWWGTTELGYIAAASTDYPYELLWFPKKELIEEIHKSFKLFGHNEIWWNPKFGNIEECFEGEELKKVQLYVKGMVMKKWLDRSRGYSDDEIDMVAKEISEGTLPRTELK